MTAPVKTETNGTEEVRAHCERCYDDKAETPKTGREDSTTEDQW